MDVNTITTKRDQWIGKFCSAWDNHLTSMASCKQSKIDTINTNMDAKIAELREQCGIRIDELRKQLEDDVRAVDRERVTAVARTNAQYADEVRVFIKSHLKSQSWLEWICSYIIKYEDQNTQRDPVDTHASTLLTTTPDPTVDDVD